MRLEGAKSFPTDPMTTYSVLTNPDLIQKSMPGLKSLEAESDTFYRAKMEVGVAGIKGAYDGTLEMADVHPGENYRLKVKGEGPMGFLEADVLVEITEKDAGSEVRYAGDAQVGGTVAGVGQRVLGGVAKMLISQFFNHLVKEAKQLAQ